MTGVEKLQQFIDEIKDTQFTTREPKEGESMTTSTRYSNYEPPVIYCTGEFENELEIRFSNRLDDSLKKHYPMIVNKVIELGGIIKETHPATLKTTVKFYE